MKWLAAGVTSAVLLTTPTVFGVRGGNTALADAPAAVKSLTTRFTYKATVPELPAGSKSLDLWLPLPSDSEWQTIREVKVDAPIPNRITQEKKHGNRMVYLHADNPTVPLVVTVTFTVDRKEARILGAPGNRATAIGSAESSYLAADKNVPLGGRYAEIAKEVAGNKTTPTDKVRAIFEHVVATMQYDYKKESPKLGEGDVAFVCDYKKGNCSDLHSYMISLARNLKVPAYLEYGFPVGGIPLADPLPKEGTLGGYHCWMWYHDPAYGWVPVDASDARRWLDSKKPEIKEQLFGNLIVERSAVAFSRGRDLTLVPAQKGGSLNYFIYPYAEADGSSVKATWEVKYSLPDAASAGSAPTEPASQGVQAQIDELRRLVQQQQQEIARLKEQVAQGGRATTPPTAVPVTTPSKEQLQFYGFLRLDGMSDWGLANSGQSPQWILSPGNANVAKTGNSQFSLHPRLTRIGINYTAPTDTIRDWKVTGKFEMDWQNGAGVTAESRPLPRIRHAYIQLQKGPVNWLLGQTWDLMSPLFPASNDDTLMWNAGNLGDRRAQIRLTYDPKEAPVNAALALGLTGAIDAKDLDTNTVRDGEDSGLPNVQARVGIKNGASSYGLWGHHGWERTTKVLMGRRNFNSYSLGLDVSQALSSQWMLRGELWQGGNLSDFRGGIGQGIDPATGNEVRSHGGWIEIGYQPNAKRRYALGYTRENPFNRDIPNGGRTENYTYYLHNRWSLPGNVDFGLNYIYWTTRWKGLPTGIDHRINWFFQHNF